MAGTGVRRFWRIYRENYAQEQSRREAREQERPWTTARTGFWATLALALTLNLIDAVAGLEGTAWKTLRLVVGVAWTVFAIWYLAEVLAKWRARKAQ
jgi:hypothetical protein